MKGLMSLMAAVVVLVAVMVFVPGCDVAQAATANTAKINPQKNTVIYFGHGMTATGKVVDTLVWSSDRDFKDSTNYDCAAFATGVNTTGYLTVSILNDSSIIVTSSAAGDSLKTYFYEVILKKK